MVCGQCSCKLVQHCYTYIGRVSANPATHNYYFVQTETRHTLHKPLCNKYVSVTFSYQLHKLSENMKLNLIITIDTLYNHISMVKYILSMGQPSHVTPQYGEYIIHGDTKDLVSDSQTLLLATVFLFNARRSTTCNDQSRCKTFLFCYLKHRQYILRTGSGS